MYIKVEKKKRNVLRDATNGLHSKTRVILAYFERERVREDNTHALLYIRPHILYRYICDYVINCFYVVMYKVIFIKLQYNYMQILLKIVLHRSQSREHLHVSLFLHS